MPELRATGNPRHVHRGEALPAEVLSANTYLGALAGGARAGRGCRHRNHRPLRRQAAVTLGALIHEFGWSPIDFDRLAGGQPGRPHHRVRLPKPPADSHRLAAGARLGAHRLPDHRLQRRRQLRAHQAARHRRPDPARMRSRADAVRDPATRPPYLLPDVTCDFREVRIDQISDERVRISGGARARTGRKLQGVGDATGRLPLRGHDGGRWHRRSGQGATHRRSNHPTHIATSLPRRGLPDYTRCPRQNCSAPRTSTGHKARTGASREAMVRVVVDPHPMKRALEIFAREIAPRRHIVVSGTTMPTGGRPSPSPRLISSSFSFRLDSAALPVASSSMATHVRWTSCPPRSQRQRPPRLPSHPHRGSTRQAKP